MTSRDLSTRNRCTGEFTRIITVGLLVLAFAATAVAGPPPDFRLKDLDGNWFELSEHLGHDVVYVTFWATWCIPCRREFKHLEALQTDFADSGFLVVGVNTDSAATMSKIKPYLKRYGISYLTVLDPDNNVLDKYNPTRDLPYGVLVDRTGNVHDVFAGYRAGDEIRLRKEVESLLAEPAPDQTHADDGQ